MAKKPPGKFRRVTKAEAKRLGVSYGAKRQVRDGTRVTKNTPTFSNRYVAQGRIERTTGVKQSKEKFRTSRIEPRIAFSKTNGKKSETYRNLSKRELMQVLRERKHQGVVLVIHGVFGGAGKSDSHGQRTWHHGISEIDAEQLLDPENFDEYLDDSGTLSRPTRYGAIFR